MTICTQQVDLTYLFCEREVTENTLLCAGTQSCTQIKKDKLIRRTIHSSTYKYNSRRFRMQEATKPRPQASGRPELLFKEVPWFPPVDLRMQQALPAVRPLPRRLKQDTTPVGVASGLWEPWGFGEGQGGGTVAFSSVGPEWGHVSGVFSMELAGDGGPAGGSALLSRFLCSC